MERTPEVISFKADKGLAEALRGLPNRSAFIREAIMAALETRCPLCQGTGIMTEVQQARWNSFMTDHHLEFSDNGHFSRVVCDRDKNGH